MTIVRVSDIFFKEGILYAEASEFSGNKLYPVTFTFLMNTDYYNSRINDQEDKIIIPAKVIQDFGGGWEKIEYKLDLKNERVYIDYTDFTYNSKAINIVDFTEHDIEMVLNKSIKPISKEDLYRVLDFLQTIDGNPRTQDRLFLYSKETFDNLRKTLPSIEDLRKLKYDDLLKIYQKPLQRNTLDKTAVTYNHLNKSVFEDYQVDVYLVLKEKNNEKETWFKLRSELMSTDDIQHQSEEQLKSQFNASENKIYYSVKDDFGYTPADDYKSDLMNELRARNIPIILK